MASASARKTKRRPDQSGGVEKLPSGRFRASFRINGKRYFVPGTFPRKTDAAAAIPDAISKKREELAKRVAAPTGADMTFGEWWEQWQATRFVEASTALLERETYRSAIGPYWSQTPLSEITHEGVQTWVDTLRGGNSGAARIVRIFAMLRSALIAAGKRVQPDVYKNLRLPTVPKTARRPYDPAALTKVLAQTSDHYRLVIEFMIEAGVRPGEMCGLHRDNVLGDVLLVAEARSGVADIIKRPKDEDVRYLPLTRRAREILAIWDTTMPRTGAGCGLTHTNVEHRRSCTSDLVVRQVRGTPLRPKRLTTIMWEACRDAGVTGVGLTPYGSRHTWATKLAAGGVDPYTLKELLGHATLTQALNYIHTTSPSMTDVRNILERDVVDHGVDHELDTTSHKTDENEPE